MNDLDSGNISDEMTVEAATDSYFEFLWGSTVNICGNTVMITHSTHSRPYRSGNIR